jgi:diguanylate cyclase (GGDEF)-like protein
VRNLSDLGACLQVNAVTGIPQTFDLLMDNDSRGRPCKVTWIALTRIGIEFHLPGEAHQRDVARTSNKSFPPPSPSQVESHGGQVLRRELLVSALDEAPVGILLLDADMRAQFINRAFREMWRLPDDKADCGPSFVALLYHGLDTDAHAIPSERLDAYVAERVEHVKAGDSKPISLRLANGEIVRLQCAVLPSGGRMLCYTYVNDIVPHSVDFRRLRDAFDQMQPGIILLDEFFNSQYVNRAARELWQVSDEQANRAFPYVEMGGKFRNASNNGEKSGAFDNYIASRTAVVRAGDPAPIDIPHPDGRIIRSQCAVLPDDGRMLIYTDVTDLVRRSDQFEQMAMLDGITGLYNRRHFETLAEIEWGRFQRYHRPLSLILVDIDCFKRINDLHGHEAGDLAIIWVAASCTEGKRAEDVVARMGGDEFVVLLPETNLQQAGMVAQRLQKSIRDKDPCRTQSGAVVPVTVSIGIAAATLSMSGVGALLRLADKALYEAKAAGRNCTKCIEEPSTSDIRAAAE